MINVEGNFTRANAFWSAELANKPAAEVEALLHGYRADPAGWFDCTTDPYEIASARAMLAFQPARTVRAMAASVAAVAGAPNWEPLLRRLFAGIPVHLVAGEMSRPAGTSRTGLYKRRVATQSSPAWDTQ